MTLARDEDRRAAIVLAARRWIGTPYVHQASLIGVGCDCLGLVRGVWRDVVGQEPEQAAAYQPDWAEAGARETLLMAARRHFLPVEGDTWRTGDVLLFRWRSNCAAKHVAIATSDTHMVHAHDGASVCEVNVGRHWRKRLAGVFAFPQAR